MAAENSSPLHPPKTPEKPPILKAADRVLYPSTLGCTAVILGFQVWEFWQGGDYRPRWPFAEVYLAVLTAYAAQRELSKWKGIDEPSIRLRRGELYVALWIAAWLTTTAIANLYSRFTLPSELKTITLGVLGIFAATGVSAGLRQKREAGRSASDESGNAAERRAALLKLLAERGSLNSEEAAQSLGTSAVSAWRLLEALEKEDAVVQEPSSDPRQRRYRLKK